MRNDDLGAIIGALVGCLKVADGGTIHGPEPNGEVGMDGTMGPNLAPGV